MLIERSSYVRARSVSISLLTPFKIVKRKKRGRGAWNRTKVSEFKARCDKPLHYTPTNTTGYFFRTSINRLPYLTADLEKAPNDGIEPPDVSHCCKYPKNWSVVGESNSVNPGKSRVLRHQSLQPKIQQNSVDEHVKLKVWCSLCVAVTILKLVPRARIELAISAYQAHVIPFNYPGKNYGDSAGNRTPISS